MIDTPVANGDDLWGSGPVLSPHSVLGNNIQEYATRHLL